METISYFTRENYNRYLESWLDGIKSEVWFWDGLMRTRGKQFPSMNFEAMATNKKPFSPDVEKEFSGEKTKLLDVGSGPFSRLGNIQSTTALDFYAVDPLAHIYKNLKQRYNIVTDIVPEFAMAERLTSKFSEKEFDMVHMSNALDHSFDPVRGIYQMLSVCKIGGKIVLRHHKDEAENENYEGFHQWNLNVKDGSFIVWRPGICFNISDMLKDCASIRIEENVTEHGGQWVYDNVAITKLSPPP